MRVSPPALLLVLVLAAGGARAEGVFAGAAARTGSLSGVADKVSVSLGKALAKGGTVDLGAKAQRPPVRPERLEEIQRLLADARGRYLEGDFKEALIQSADALKRFEERFAFTTSQEAWTAFGEVLLVRSLALRRLDQEQEADLDFAQLAAALPDYVPDPGLAPPKVATRFQEVSRKLKARPPVSVEITSRPAGAPVVVDGRNAGVTPLTLDALVPGVHYIAVGQDAQRLERRLVLTKGKEKITADLGDPRAVAARTLVDAVKVPLAEEAVIRLASAVAADTVVAVVEPDRDELLVLAARVQGGRLVAVTGQRVDSGLESVDEAMAALARVAATATADRLLGKPPAEGSGLGDLRSRFLAPADKRAVGEDDGSGTLLAVVGGSVIVAALAAAVVLGAAVYMTRPTNPGGTDVVIDGSSL